MERIYGGRGQGKTKRLMEAAAKVGGVIVCRNPVAMKKQRGATPAKVMPMSRKMN